jgi:sugar phosphate isomerase/epimerase
MSIHPRISVNQECSTHLTFAEDVAFWQDLGVDLVGVISTKLEPEGWDTEALTKAGIRVSNVGTETRFLPHALRFAASTQAESVWICTGPLGPRTWEQAADDFCQEIAPAVALAKDLGVALAVEPTNSLRGDVSFIYTMRDTMDLARAAGIGVVLESFMCWYERGLDELVRNNVDLLTLVQICDYQIGTFNTPNRSVIGDGDIPLERLISMVLDAGYQGTFDLEILGPKIEAEGYASATRRSLDRAGEILQRLGA